tara:strand:- start:872 stop:1438 length:567 start_codon:yes stop_codon:yes gene_type:complete
MRIFLSVLLLIFIYQNSIKADDIKDFEIEGISIGNSLLNYFSEKEILNTKANWYNDNKYSTSQLTLKKYEIFKDLDISYLTSDKNYIIVGFSAIHSDADKNNCKSIQNEIVSDISKMFSVRVIKETLTHPIDKSGKSKVDVADFDLKDGSRVGVQCFYFSDNVSFNDGLKISIVTPDFIDWMANVAYK